MKEQLPTVLIHDRYFQMDVRASEFREVTNDTNRIPFREVQDNGDHLLIAYDKKTHNAFQGSIEELSSSKEVQVVRLPSWKEIARSNEQQATTMTEPSGPKFLPIISIAGTDFTADVRLEELRQTQQPHNRISFDVLDTVGKGLGFFYDPKTRNAFEGTKEELDTRRDIRLIILPPMSELSSSHSQKRFNADSIGYPKKGQTQRQETAPPRKRKGRGI